MSNNMYYTPVTCPAGSVEGGAVSPTTGDATIRCFDTSEKKKPTCPAGSTSLEQEYDDGSTSDVRCQPYPNQPQCTDDGFELSFRDKRCMKTSDPQCPPGSAVMLVFTKTGPKAVCMPRDAETYDRPEGDERCNDDDVAQGIFENGRMKAKCYKVTPAPPASAAANSAAANSAASADANSAAANTAASASSNTSSSSDFATLSTTYQQQVDAYEAAIDTAIRENASSRLPEIRAKSQEIQATLNKMIESITYLKKDTPNIQAQRDELLAKLRRIQQDYNGLIENTDDIETLKRIRQQESEEGKRQLTLYLIFFILLALLILLYLLFMGNGQKKDVTASTPTTPAMSPALT